MSSSLSPDSLEIQGLSEDVYVGFGFCAPRFVYREFAEARAFRVVAPVLPFDTRAGALRFAQETLRADQRHRAPLHWAAWVLAGEGW